MNDPASKTPPDTPKIAPVEMVEAETVEAETVGTAPEAEVEEIEIPVDPEAQAADRAGFKFLAIGFLFFFVIIAVCASIVALMMKKMGI